MTAEKNNDTQTPKSYRALILGVAIAFVICALGVSAVFIYQKIHEGKIYSQVNVGEVKLSRLSLVQAVDTLRNAFKQNYGSGFSFSYDDKTAVLPNEIELAEGVEGLVLEVDYEKTAERAFWLARSGNSLFDLKDQLIMLIFSKKIQPVYKFDRQFMADWLIENFHQFEDPAGSAKLIVETDGKTLDAMNAKILNEKEGLAFDYDEIINQFVDQAENFQNSNIALILKKDLPEIKASEASDVPAEVRKVIGANEKIVFNYDDKKWAADWQEYAKWLSLEKDGQGVHLTFDKDKFFDYLSDISKEIDVPAKNAKFELENGRVDEFQASQNGLAVNAEATYSGLVEQFFNNDPEIDLVVEEKSPEVTSENINEMGVKELIGVGESDFSGSPANRRHNISVGSKTVHGILIKPDEEFSLTKTLGHIDGAAGYLPELVIRDNRTIPEYGGGLCQVGTTMFRAAINTGLPVTERRPHSYRVSYYEPAGFDATIYDPSPDVKFINDTGHYILIQTEIIGNILRFEFWGTDDGRKVEVTDPVIFNITYPGPTKEIVSPDLEPGQRKCTERAHNGADAVFYRTITPASGDAIKETWSSTYRPWQAVCLVGPEAPAAEEPAAPAEPSTPIQ
ncbi:MAG: VanW family protein [Patescibacteria group bacterium]